MSKHSEGRSTPRFAQLMIFLLVAAVILIGLVEVSGLFAPGTSENVSSDDRVLICRAAIATIMGRPIDIITGTEDRNEVVRTDYRRPDDGTTWRNACQLVGDRIVWASVRRDGSIGRWRNDRLDSVVTFRLSDRKVTIEDSFADGSSMTKSYLRGPASPIEGEVSEPGRDCQVTRASVRLGFSRDFNSLT